MDIRFRETLCRLACTSLLLVTATLYGQTNWHVATDGNDNSGDGSFNTPYATIDRAGEQTQPGDTVFVHQGTYRNAEFGDGDIWTGSPVANITANGNPDNYITFIPYPGEQVIIEFDGLYGILLRNASYVNIIGFELRGIAAQISLAEAQAAWGLYKDENGILHDLATEMGIDITDPSLIDQELTKPETPNITRPVYYNGRGLVANKSHHIRLKSNRIYDVPASAIRAQQSDYITISDNEVYHNTYWTTLGVGAITVAESMVRPEDDIFEGTKIIIERNRVYENENRLISWSPLKLFVKFVIDEGTGIFLTRNSNTYQQGYISIVNNLSYRNGASGIVCHVTDRAIIEHNTVYDNATTNHGTAGGIGINDVDDVRIINNISISKPHKWALGILAQPANNVHVMGNLLYNNNGFETIHRNIPEGWISGNPALIDPEQGNLLLQATSLAIDNGVPSDQLFDFAGNARDEQVDIGAYEYQATVQATESDFPETEVLVFPNPTNGLIVIQNLPSTHTPFVVYDSLGRTVNLPLVGKDNTSLTLDGSALTNGIYFVSIDGQTKKVIIRK